MNFSFPWFRRSVDPTRLVVLDDFFPNLLTGFRVAEYNAYLDAFPNLQVLSTLHDFDSHKASYQALYGQHVQRVLPYKKKMLAGAAAAHMNFLNNAAGFLSHLTRFQVPFSMTLYPGGGFGLDSPDSDEKLLRVLRSPLLKAIIVTQPVTQDYVRSFARKRGLPVPVMHEIRGVVVNPLYFDSTAAARERYFGEGKDAIDICFVAERYMHRGENKGFPYFAQLVEAFLDTPQVRFHVIGSFTEADLDSIEAHQRVRFHGRVETSQLREFFRGMDLVVSPNEPYVLHPGNFDGFPTGGCVEAALCGVGMVATDALGQNPGYVHGESMLIVAAEAQALIDNLRILLAEPQRVGALARAGQALTRKLYAPDYQIGRRVELLRQMQAAL